MTRPETKRRLYFQITYIINCSISAEQKDGRYAVVLDDVIGAEIRNLKVKEGITDKENVKSLRSEKVIIK